MFPAAATDGMRPALLHFPQQTLPFVAVHLAQHCRVANTLHQCNGGSEQQRAITTPRPAYLLRLSEKLHYTQQVWRAAVWWLHVHGKDALLHRTQPLDLRTRTLNQPITRTFSSITSRGSTDAPSEPPPLATATAVDGDPAVPAAPLVGADDGARGLDPDPLPLPLPLPLRMGLNRDWDEKVRRGEDVAGRAAGGRAGGSPSAACLASNSLVSAMAMCCCARVDTCSLSSAGHTTCSNRRDALRASCLAFFFAAVFASRSIFWRSTSTMGERLHAGVGRP